MSKFEELKEKFENKKESFEIKKDKILCIETKEKINFNDFVELTEEIKKIISEEKINIFGVSLKNGNGTMFNQKKNVFIISTLSKNSLLQEEIDTAINLSRNGKTVRLYDNKFGVGLEFNIFMEMSVSRFNNASSKKENILTSDYLKKFNFLKIKIKIK